MKISSGRTKPSLLVELVFAPTGVASDAEGGSLGGAGRSVTDAGRNSSSPNASRSKGHMPETLKPDMLLTGETAFTHAAPTSCAI